MKKIALIGLVNFENIGDQILRDTCNYLVQRKITDSNITAVMLDMQPSRRYFLKKKCYFRVFIHKILSGSSYYVKKFFGYHNSLYYIERVSWKVLFQKYYREKLSDIDAIIFIGGGFIKFKTQGLNYAVEFITEIADERTIPVMMNAQGIEGYNDCDLRCINLKKAINRKCMKVITTRDDIETLNGKYLENKPDVTVSLVGDPALWIPECYKKDIVNKNRECIGINVIRHNIFKDYGYTFTGDEMMQFYISLIKELEKREIKWVLFSNGMEADHKFGEELLMNLGISDSSKLLPRPRTPIELINMINSFSAIFGARLHACLTAYSIDVPVTGFIWNEKLHFFAQIIDRENNFFPVEKINAVDIANSIISSIGKTYDNEKRQDLKNLTYLYLEQFIQDEIKN